MSEKKYVSTSQMESYCRCPEAYKRRYLDGDIVPPGIATLKGSGLHRGAEVNMRQKIESRVDLSASEIVDAAISAFETQTAGGYILTEEEQERGSSVVIGEAKDSLADMAQAHAELQAPSYQPVMVEERVRISLPSSTRDLLGIIDLADSHDMVVDFKTSGKKKSQADADSSVQLSVYAIAFQAATGRAPRGVRLDTLVQTKKKTERQVIDSQRDHNDLLALANRINAVVKGIDAGSFPPATPGAWWCGPKWCGYWQTCPYVNSERQSLVQIGE